jgi:hypothetical protein
MSQRELCGEHLSFWPPVQLNGVAPLPSKVPPGPMHRPPALRPNAACTSGRGGGDDWRNRFRPSRKHDVQADSGTGTATLTLTASGRSGETVSSSPSGLKVAVGSVGSASFAAGTSITLSVSNSRDAVWSGACSSNGNKTKTCTFTPNANASVWEKCSRGRLNTMTPFVLRRSFGGSRMRLALVLGITTHKGCAAAPYDRDGTPFPCRIQGRSSSWNVSPVSLFLLATAKDSAPRVHPRRRWRPRRTALTLGSGLTQVTHRPRRPDKVVGRRISGRRCSGAARGP